MGGSKDHIGITLIHPGSKVQGKGIPEAMPCRILLSMRATAHISGKPKQRHGSCIRPTIRSHVPP